LKKDTIFVTSVELKVRSLFVNPVAYQQCMLDVGKIVITKNFIQYIFIGV